MYTGGQCLVALFLGPFQATPCSLVDVVASHCQASGKSSKLNV